MWKKMSIAIALGLFLSPSGVLAGTAANAQFDPFAEIVEGIAQSMATGGDFTSESNYDGTYNGRATGNDKRIAGNVIIGSPLSDQAQMAVVEGTIDFNMNASSGTSQAVNLVVHDGEVPVLVMQGTSAGGSITMASSNADSSVQAINLVTK